MIEEAKDDNVFYTVADWQKSGGGVSGSQAPTRGADVKPSGGAAIVIAPPVNKRSNYSMRYKKLLAQSAAAAKMAIDNTSHNSPSARSLGHSR